MELRQLEYFLAVVEEGSFTAAAARLYMVQSSLSASLLSLERELGTELFIRGRRGTELTDAGRALLEPARPFHPNLRDGHICLEVYPGEPLVEICEALHSLFSWRLRQLAENDALNRDACAWGRAHLDELPVDTRPLFGRQLRITLEPVEDAPLLVLSVGVLHADPF